MPTSARAGADDNASLAVAGGAAESARTDDASIRAQEGDETEGDRLSEEVEQLLMDIKTGKVKTTVYTLDEHMRYLDSIRSS